METSFCSFTVKTVLFYQRLKLSHLLRDPTLISVQFLCHDFRHRLRHFAGGPGVQKESARAACKRIFDCSGHFMSCCPYNFCADVGKGRMQGGGEFRIRGGDLSDRFCIRTVNPKAAQGASIFCIAVNFECLRDAWLFTQAAQGDGMVYAVFSHVTVRGPFTSGDGEQAGVVHVDCVVARKCRGFARSSSSFDQWANACKYAEYIAAPGRTAEVLRCRIENELNLFLQCARLVGWFFNRSVRCADQGVLVPGDGKHHAAIAGARNHDGCVSGKERPLEDEMDALAWLDHGG